MNSNLDQFRRDAAKDKLRANRAYERAIANGNGAVDAYIASIHASPSASEMDKREMRFLMRYEADHPAWLKYARVIDPVAGVDRNIMTLTEAIAKEHARCAMDHQVWTWRGGVQRLKLARNALMVLRWARRYGHVQKLMEAAE